MELQSSFIQISHCTQCRVKPHSELLSITPSSEPVAFSLSQWNVHQDVVQGAVLHSCTFLLVLCGAKPLLKNQRMCCAVHGSICTQTGFTHNTGICCWNKKSLKKNKSHTDQAIGFHVRALESSHKVKDRFGVLVSAWLQARCCRCTRQEERKAQQLLLLSLDCKQCNLHFWC